MFSFVKCWFYPHEYVEKEVDGIHGRYADYDDDGYDNGQEYVTIWRGCQCNNCGRDDPTFKRIFLRCAPIADGSW